jgi:hypothetical protein
MKKMIFAAMLLIASGAQANDAGLENLKNSFAGLIKTSSKEFDRAAAMKTVSVVRGEEITKAHCDGIAAQIASNYKINPFECIHETGSSFNSMCGGRWGWQKNYLAKVSGTANLGAPYVAVIQLEGSEDGGYRSEISYYFLDAANRIIETQHIAANRKTGEILVYGITAIDGTGNIYISVFDKHYSISGGIAKDVSGTHRMEQFVSADGSTPSALLRNTVKNASDSSKDYQILSWDRADQKDWQDYQTSITHGTGYYVYDGKFYSNFSKPNFKSGLTIKNRGGREFCAYGSVKNDTSWATLPADQTAYSDCGNY